MTKFQRAVRDQRRRMLLTQDEYAAFLGVSRGAVAAWELGTRTPTPRMARILVDKGVDHDAVLSTQLDAPDAADGAAA